MLLLATVFALAAMVLAGVLALRLPGSEASRAVIEKKIEKTGARYRLRTIFRTVLQLTFKYPALHLPRGASFSSRAGASQCKCKIWLWQYQPRYCLRY